MASLLLLLLRFVMRNNAEEGEIISSDGQTDGHAARVRARWNFSD